jgi:hypothetical protein
MKSSDWTRKAHSFDAFPIELLWHGGLQALAKGTSDWPGTSPLTSMMMFVRVPISQRYCAESTMCLTLEATFRT